MRDLCRRSLLAALVLGLAGLSTSAYAAGTVSLKAVKKNGVAIAATNTVQAAPNDIIEVELRTWGWANDVQGQTQIKTIQAEIAMRAGATSSGCGTAIPTGWDRPLDTIACTSPVQCPAEYPICDVAGCQGPDHHPQDPDGAAPWTDAYIDGSRANAVFQPQPAIYAVSTFNLDYPYGGVSLGPPVSDPGAGSPRYLGTFSLQLSSDACGTFTFALKPGTVDTPLTWFQFANNEVKIASVLEPLVIQLAEGGACCNGETCTVTTEAACDGDWKGPGTTCTPNPCACNRISAVDPLNCAIDARRPHAPTSLIPPLGFNKLRLRFGAGIPAGLVAGNFTITQTVGGSVPTISNIAQFPPNEVELTLNRPVSRFAWTCVAFNVCEAATNRVCYGALPGDVDADRTTDAGDLAELIADLAPPQSLALWQSDTDRSSSAAAPDIIDWVDLANGAQQYDVYLNTTIPVVCPTAP